MKLSVNILSWDCVETLSEILFMLTEDLKGVEHEVIVVDNGSTDGSEGYATIKNGKNMGISIAKNQGIDASRGEYILMLDEDVVPVPNMIYQMFLWLEANPKEYAIGAYQNKWTSQRNNKFGQKHHETDCKQLVRVQSQCATCLYFGLFRRTLFTDLKLRLDESGPFKGEGYGWEDRDFFMQMKEKGVKQWVAAPNHVGGKYFHAINSSIRIMGHEKYNSSSKERHAYYKEKWNVRQSSTRPS